MIRSDAAGVHQEAASLKPQQFCISTAPCTLMSLSPLAVPVFGSLNIPVDPELWTKLSET